MKRYGSEKELLDEMFRGGRTKIDPGRRVCLYHTVLGEETFDDAAQHLFSIVHLAQQDFPGQPRSLYLDIDGHRNRAGGFDTDMVELQQEFVIRVLAPWLTEVHMPLIGFVKETQDDDLPPELVIP